MWNGFSDIMLNEKGKIQRDRCSSYLPFVKKQKIRKYSSTARLGKQNNTTWKG